MESSCSTTTNGQGNKVTTCVYDCNCANRDCISVGACNSTSTRNCNTILGYPKTELKKWRGKHVRAVPWQQHRWGELPGADVVGCAAVFPTWQRIRGEARGVLCATQHLHW